MIRLEQLFKSYGQKILLGDVSLQFPLGEKIALVGANGTGKSTLLNILAQKEEADSGNVFYPSDMSLAYLPQEPNPSPEASVILECEAGNPKLRSLQLQLNTLLEQIENNCKDEYLEAYEETEAAFKTAGGYELRSRAQSILAGLGFSDAVCSDSPLNLSGGWRMRLELAKLFVRQPDFLILDEPTNHLDLPSLLWVENYLKSYTKTLLFVSHDRALLNRLSTVTIELKQGNLTVYKGNFNDYLRAKEIRESQDAAHKAQIEKQKDHLESFIKRFGAKASKAKQAQSRAKMLARLTESEEGSVEHQNKKIHFQLPAPLNSPRIMMQVKNGTIGYQKPLASRIDFEIERQQKIAVIGANGIGKSTLLKTLIGRMTPIAGQFDRPPGLIPAYFAQDQLDTLDENKSVMANLQMHSQLGEPQIRNILGGFLFHGDDIFKEVKVLSGGEKSRVGLASILSRPANFLVLDEPSNHLDMSSANSLAKALTEYSGTLIFVSHDRELIDKVCTHVFAMLPDGRSRLFEGQLADYEHQAELAGFPNVLQIDTSSTTNDPSSKTKLRPTTKNDEIEVKALKKKLQLLKKNLAQCEKVLSDTKTALAKEEAFMLQLAPDDFEKMQASHQRHMREKTLNESKETLWLETQSEIEELESKLKALGRQ